jgi:23S rRNA pseudouridine1911/1915/1917 synthase
LKPQDFKTLLLTTSTDLAPTRLDRFLAECTEIQSRSRALRLIKDGFVTVEGKQAKASQKLTPGQTLEVQIPIVSQMEPLRAWDHPLDIVFEDEDLIVVEKPSGLVVHPSAGHETDTLVNILVHHCKDLSMGFAENRPGIIHRLDKDTRGLLVVAKNDFTQEALAQQFREKTVQRHYWAIVHGQPKEQKNTITSFLRRHPNDRKRFASDPKNKEGKRAITHYRVLETHPCGLSWLECRLDTGRTHQIRVHLSELGHPIIADPIYSSKGRLKGLSSVKVRKQVAQLVRIGLHAYELGFLHPRTQQQMMFYRGWPKDILDLCEHLGFNKALPQGESLR